MSKRPQFFDEDPADPKRHAMSVTRSSTFLNPDRNDSTVVKWCAFRISNIPRRMTEVEFFRILDSLPRETSLNDGGSNLLGKSFAPAAASVDTELYSTATVTFVSVPTLFKFSGTSCSFNLDGDSQVIVDKHFYGLTPLGISRNQTTVEYVFLSPRFKKPLTLRNQFSIFAVTGLAGHGFGSWKARNATGMWLRDFLPEHVPTARIMTYGYDTRLPGSKSTASIREFSQNFLAALNIVRVADTRRPAIFIGHSLGGLVIKQVSAKLPNTQCRQNQLICFCRRSRKPLKVVINAVWFSSRVTPFCCSVFRIKAWK